MFGKRAKQEREEESPEYADYEPALPPALSDDGHKGLAGRVACLCGSGEMPGAALLVARAAQRAGAGLVTMGCLHPRLLDALPLAAPEAVLHDLVAHAGPVEGAAAGAADAWLAREAHARLCGPGLGSGDFTRALVEHIVARCGPEPLVLDADALNVYAGRLAELRRRRAPTVLTPHPGEAARLLGRAVASGERERYDAARELASRSGAVVVLKGAGTLVADESRVWQCEDGNAGMATAGAGDVLAGILAAYAARAVALEDAEYTAFDAACAAVWMHALAGDEAASSHGERALIASDLIDELAGVQDFNES
ncbi:MAG: NAD(P)H-hydrate dehydratase [Planctomycetota bacterium]|nr:MAG: NAD(P)H-hydrate dehydratase [Planctomycetota bacterium]